MISNIDHAAVQRIEQHLVLKVLKSILTCDGISCITLSTAQIGELGQRGLCAGDFNEASPRCSFDIIPIEKHECPEFPSLWCTMPIANIGFWAILTQELKFATVVKERQMSCGVLLLQG